MERDTGEHPGHGAPGAAQNGHVSGTRSRATVLICDDEPRLAALTAGLLEQSGFSTATAVRGEDALSFMAASLPHALLLDVTLAGLTARQLLARLQEQGLAVPVVLTSGYAEEDVDPALMQDPLVAGYLAKPYTVHCLVQAIEQALSSPPRGATKSVA